MSTPLLLLEPIGGIAGDMFLAAALDAGVDRSALEARLATLGLPGWRLEVTRRSVSGIQATHVDVVVEGEQPPSRRLADVLDLVGRSGLPPRARAAALAVFERIGRAEAKVHGVPVEEVHFHEVGAVDSIVDVCGAAVVLDLLGWPRVVASPPELGRGLVKTAHGPMPVPPPAVLELLAGKPVRPGGPPGEAVTPTGAALLAHFCEVGPLPPFVARAVGYGAGTVAWPDRPNVLRLVLADPAPLAATGPAIAGAPHDGALFVVETNLDDCPGQLVARALEALLEAGALDAWAAPLTMKKGRPGVLVGALCDGARRAAVTRVLLTETTTLGVRFHRVEREELARALHEVETPYGRVRVKVGTLDGREVGAHPEYEDCRARAAEHGVAVREVMAAALAAWRGRSRS
jgi:uncharacterized protein (TIGR00299 family) protein